MTFSCPSFLAAAISAVIPPPCATDVALDQPVLPPLLFVPPPQPAASRAPLSAAAATAIVVVFRTISLRACDHDGQDGAIVAVPDARRAAYSRRAAAAIAAPTIPASLWSAAGTTGACNVSLGRNLSDFLLMPPPMMNRSGESSASILSR